MCIAIFASPHTKVPEEHLLESYKSNKDGCGFAYVSTDYTGHKKIKIYKTMDYDKFLKNYNRAFKNNPESPFLIHFRIATHGTVDTFNCHPFKVNKNLAFIHNGIISGVGTDAKKSDTQMFNDVILKNLPKDFYKYEHYKLLIEKFIVGSKIIMLDVDGNYQIYNESSGHWLNDVWYSNSSYKSFKYTPTVHKGGKKFVNNQQYQDFYLCDGCNYMHNPNKVNFYKTWTGELKCYCDQCKVAALMNGDVSQGMGISKWKYDMDSDGMYGCY